MIYKKLQSGISWLLFALVIVIFVFSLTLFWPSMARSKEMQKDLERLSKTLETRKAKRAELLQAVHDLERDPAAAERIARERFNLCREGEIVIKYDR